MEQWPSGVTRVVDGEIIILHRAKGTVHQLNPPATFIWHHCDGSHTPDEIAGKLATHFYDAPGHLLDHVVETLAQLGKLGLLDSGLI